MIPDYLKEEFKPDYPSWIKAKETDRGDLVNDVYMPSLKVKKLDTGQTDYYHFVFEEPFAWAIFSINDRTGEFSIQSDWGNWSYRWNIDNLGDTSLKHPKPLTYFLSDRDECSYIVNKFAYNRKDREEFDGEATRKAVKRIIISLRQDRELDQASARMYWDRLINFDMAHSYMFISEVDYGFADHGVLLEMAYDALHFRQSAHFNILQYKLLPFFINYLNREIL